MITQRRLRELVDYDPASGEFRWRPGSSKYPAQSAKRTGKIATCRQGYGYNTLYLDGEKFNAGRMAWLYMTGSWPDFQIDHINQKRDDDRWENLRQATAAQNAHNRTLQSSNTSGCRGVNWQAGKWYARITVKGVVHNLGAFAVFEDAVEARERAALKMHGEFAALDSLSPNNLQ